MTEPAQPFSRRDFLQRAATLAAVTPLAAPFVNRRRYELFASTPWAQEFSERTVRLVREATVIDMLCPLKIAGDDVARWMKDPSSFSERDFAYYRDSGIDVFHPTGGGTWSGVSTSVRNSSSPGGAPSGYRTRPLIS